MFVISDWLNKVSHYIEYQHIENPVLCKKKRGYSLPIHRNTLWQSLMELGRALAIAFTAGIVILLLVFVFALLSNGFT
jgi:hypothetical protein